MTAESDPQPASDPSADTTILARCGRCGSVIRLARDTVRRIQTCPRCSATIRAPASDETGIVLVATDVSAGADRLLTFSCERCDSVLESPLGFAGEVGRCPTCGARFRIPAYDAASDQIVGYELLDANDQNPVPLHAYAANGLQAPAIVTDTRGESSIQCRRCGTRCAMEADVCSGCGVPFTIEGAPPVRPRSQRAGRAVAALILATLAVPLSVLFVPAILALMLALTARDGPSGRMSSTAMVAAGLSVVSVLIGAALIIGNGGC